MGQTLRCSDCQQDKQETEFHKASTIARGFSYKCRTCTTTYQKSRWAARDLLQEHMNKDAMKYREWRKSQ